MSGQNEEAERREDVLIEEKNEDQQEVVVAEETAEAASKPVSMNDRFKRRRGEPAAEKVEVESEEEKKPVGRKSLMKSQSMEQEDQEAELSMLRSFLLTVVAVIIAIDDEWIWIPGSIYGVLYYFYKRLRDTAYEVSTCSPQALLSGVLGGATATVVSPSLTSLTKSILGDRARGLRTTARAMFLSPGGVVSPFTWGLRMTFFTYFMRHSIEDTHQIEDSFYHRWSSLALGGAFTETVARTVVAPAAKMVDKTRKNPEMNTGDVFKMLKKGKGFTGLWQGMAPYRVEVPHMSLLLSTYAMLRGHVAGYLPKKEEETFSDMLMHVPADMLCGGVAAGVAHTATHAWRCSYEAQRGNDSHFSRTLGVSTCPLVARHSTVPLLQALALRVPHTALIFGIYGFAMSAMTDKYPHNGTTGWGEFDVQRATQYGGGLKNTKEEEKSFWAFFGIRFAQVQKYDTHKYENGRTNDDEGN